MNRRLFAIAASIIAAACSPEKMDVYNAPMTEGQGMESLVLGKTTLNEAKKVLGDSARVYTLPERIVVEATPLKLNFSLGYGENEPVLQNIVAEKNSLPGKISYAGKTSRGIGLLDTLEKMESVYGKADHMADTHPDRIYYYKSGVIFEIRYANMVYRYDGPVVGPNTMVVTSIAVTPPFEVVPAPGGSTITLKLRPLF